MCMCLITMHHDAVFSTPFLDLLGEDRKIWVLLAHRKTRLYVIVLLRP